MVTNGRRAVVKTVAWRLKSCLAAISWSSVLAMPIAAQSAPSSTKTVATTELSSKLHGYQQSKMQAAIAAGLVASGEFQIVTDATERSSAMARFQQQVRELGIPATFGKCDPIGLLADASVDSNRGYGGICEVAIGSEPSALYIVCSNNMGGITLARPDVVGFSASEMEITMRRVCV